MDFGDLARGGTAPVPSKPSKTAGSNIVRPKTRAVDSDIHDTNIDLRLNRNKGGNGVGGLMNDYMDEVLVPSDWNSETTGPSGSSNYKYNQPAPPSSSGRAENSSNIPVGGQQPRAPSRNRVSKDPKRQQNNLISGLSAYTQNIPNMILHPSKKSHRTTSSTSPRAITTTKEHKNLNTLNDIRNAYGADFLPFGKPGSPARSKVGSAGSSTSGGGNISSMVPPTIPPSNNDMNANGKAESSEAIDDNTDITTQQRSTTASLSSSSVSKPRKSSRGSALESPSPSPIDPDMMMRAGSKSVRAPPSMVPATSAGTDSGGNSPSTATSRKGSLKKGAGMGGLLKSSLTGNKNQLTVIPPPSTSSSPPNVDPAILQPEMFPSHGGSSPSPLMMVEFSQQSSAGTINSMNPVCQLQSSPKLWNSSPMNDHVEDIEISNRHSNELRNTVMSNENYRSKENKIISESSEINEKQEDYDEDGLDSTNQYHSDFEEHFDTVDESSDSGAIQMKQEQDHNVKYLAKRALLEEPDDDRDEQIIVKSTAIAEKGVRVADDDYLNPSSAKRSANHHLGSIKISSNPTSGANKNPTTQHQQFEYATMANRSLRDEGYREQDDKLEYYLDGVDNNDFDISVGTSINILHSANNVHATTTLKSVATALDSNEVTTTTGSAGTVTSAGSSGSGTGSTRPQSRKLYLGSEKTQRSLNSPSSTAAAIVSVTSKAPRSAGARYVATSPMKGAEEESGDEDPTKPHLRRLSSYNDLQRGHPWSAEDHLPVRRPPSRQSSAFPVHLADDNSKAAVHVTPNVLPSSAVSPSLSKRWQQQQDQDSSLNLVNDLDNKDHLGIMSAPPTASLIVPTTASLMKPTPPILPNTEPRMVKKTKPIATPANIVDGEDATSVHSSGTLDNRPPSRQKIAAQHLFDTEGKHHDAMVGSGVNTNGGRRSAAAERRQPQADSIIPPGNVGSGYEWDHASNITGKIPARKLSSSSSGAYVPQTAFGGSRGATTAGSSSRGGTTSRAGMVYDPRDDGFMELDPEDNHMPFSINVNYGDTMLSDNHGPSLKASAISYGGNVGNNNGRSNMIRGNHVVDELLVLSDQFSDFSLNGTGNNNFNAVVSSVSGSTKSSSSKQKSSLSGNGKDDPPSDYAYAVLSPVRPKSVNNAILTTSSPVGAVSKGSTGNRILPNRGTNKSPGYYDNTTMSPINMESETLRSKSANNYLSHAREKTIHSHHENSDIERTHMPTTPLPPTKPSNRSGRPKNAAAIGSAWGAEQDPRSIPRAQV